MDNIASYHMNALDKVRYGSNGGRLMVALMFGFCLMTAISIYYMNNSSQFETSAKQMHKRYETLKKNLKEQENEKNNMRMDIRDKVTALELKEERFQTLMGNQEILQADKNDLQLKVAEYQMELESEKRNAKFLQSEVKELKNSIAEYALERKETEVLLISHREVQQELNATIAIMEEQLESYRNLVHTLQDEVEQLEKEAESKANMPEKETSTSYDQKSYVEEVAEATEHNVMENGKASSSSSATDTTAEISSLETKTVIDDEVAPPTTNVKDDVPEDVGRPPKETERVDTYDVTQPTETNYPEDAENLLPPAYDPEALNEPEISKPSSEATEDFDEAEYFEEDEQVDEMDYIDIENDTVIPEEYRAKFLSKEESRDFDYDADTSEGIASQNVSFKDYETTSDNDAGNIDEEEDQTEYLAEFEGDNSDIESDLDTFVTEDSDAENILDNEEGFDYAADYDVNESDEEDQTTDMTELNEEEKISENFRANGQDDEEYEDWDDDVDGIETFEKEDAETNFGAELDIDEIDDAPHVDYDVIVGDEDADADLADIDIY